jgi:hypothetical protein
VKNKEKREANLKKKIELEELRKKSEQQLQEDISIVNDGSRGDNMNFQSKNNSNDSG